MVSESRYRKVFKWSGQYLYQSSYSSTLMPDHECWPVQFSANTGQRFRVDSRSSTSGSGSAAVLSSVGAKFGARSLEIGTQQAALLAEPMEVPWVRRTWSIDQRRSCSLIPFHQGPAAIFQFKPDETGCCSLHASPFAQKRSQPFLAL